MVNPLSGWKPDDRAKAFCCSIVLLLLVLITYSRSFGSQFVFDSHFIVHDDARLREFSARSIQQIFSENYWWPSMYSNVYRPVATLLLAVQYSVLGFENSPPGYQLVNMALHAGAVLLAFGLLRKMGMEMAFAFAACAWFAVHPYVTEVVPNIVGVSDILAFLAILSGLHIYLNVLEGRLLPGRGIVFFGLVGLGGVLSKENSVSLIALVIWHGCTLGRERVAAMWKKRELTSAHWCGLVLMLAVLAAAILIPRFVHKEVVIAGEDPIIPDNPLREVSWVESRVNAFAILGSNIVNCLVPMTLSGDYSYGQIELGSIPPETRADWTVLAKAAAVVALGVCGLLTTRRWRVFSFSVGAVFINALPAANVIILIGTIRADRLVYPYILPVVVVAGCLVLTGWRFLEKRLASAQSSILRRGAIWGFGACMLMLAVISHLRSTDWRTHQAFWRATYQTSPNSFKAKLAWANAEGKGDETLDADIELLREAKAQLQASSRKEVREYEGADEFLAFRLVARARLYLSEGRRELAEKDLLEAEAIWEKMLEAKLVRGDLIKKKYGDTGLGTLRLKLDGPLVSLSEILRYFNRSDQAVSLLRKHGEAQRLSKVYLKSLARAEVEVGEWEKGLKRLLMVVIMHPDDVDTSREAAWILARRELPPSSRPFKTDKVQSLDGFPLLNLDDAALQPIAADAVFDLLEILKREKRDMEASAVRRQVALRLGRPEWLSASPPKGGGGGVAD